MGKSEGGVLDNDITVIIRKAGYISHGCAEDVYLHQYRAVCKGCDGINTCILLHIHVIQLPESGEGGEACDLVMGSVDRNQGVSCCECRQFRCLVVGEVQKDKVCQGSKTANVGDLVVGNVQISDGRSRSQRCDISELVVTKIEGTK